MSTNKFTEGEWQLKSDLQMYYFIDSKETGDNIATLMKTFIKISNEEAEANAKLIAAAPTMLEALYQVLKVVDLDELHPEVLFKIKAAINKATL